MYTDAYEFRRSQRSQSVRDDYNTYSRKDYNYLPDTNQGSYTNNSLTLVTFDLSSIYNSSRFTDTNDLVAVIPVIMVAAVTTGASLAASVIAPAPHGLVNLLSMKSNYVHLIHQCDVQINGKTCNDLQPYTNVLKNFEMLSEMSPSDLQIYGPTYGFGSELDNPRSVNFTPLAAAGESGTGLTNNVPFGRLLPNAANSVSATVPPTATQAQNLTTSNTAIASRLNNFVDVTAIGSGGQGIYGTVTSLGNLDAEFKPTYRVNATNYGVWTDYAIIRLGSLLESLRNIGLTRRFDAVLRMYINTGAIAVPITGANSAGQLSYGPALQGSSTFTNTCPFTINYLPCLVLDDRNIIPDTARQIAAGLFIARVPQTNLTAGATTSINLGLSNAVHPLNSCRIYYSSIEMGDPQRALTYIESNRAKKVVYRNFVSNTITGVEAGASYSSLIQSGLVNPVAIVVIPFISQLSLYPTEVGRHVPQFGSPYDTCPATGSPVSLTNFQCTVGGVNQLNTTLQYVFESFLQHVSLYDQIAGTDFGVSCGLFDKKYWEMNRTYVCLIRSKFADMDTPRNINISFRNESNVRIDLMVFSVYLDSLIIDVDTGRITR